jgi:glutathione S-transferase
MMMLHTLPGLFGLESMSPFCMKVEVYLKLARLPYRRSMGNPRTAPKGKLPYIEHDGLVVSDSTAIVEHLEKRSAQPFDVGMTDEESAHAHVIRRFLEEALYFALVWTRWIDERGWAALRTVFDDELPAAVRWAVVRMIRRSVASTLKAQGTGRHTPQEIFELAKRDVEALATMLGDRPYFLGDRMRTVDISAYAFLANILRFDVDMPLRDVARSKPNLVAFVDRMAANVSAAEESPAPSDDQLPPEAC